MANWIASTAANLPTVGPVANDTGTVNDTGLQYLFANGAWNAITAQLPATSQTGNAAGTLCAGDDPRFSDLEKLKNDFDTLIQGLINNGVDVPLNLYPNK